MPLQFPTLLYVTGKNERHLFWTMHLKDLRFILSDAVTNGNSVGVGWVISIICIQYFAIRYFVWSILCSFDSVLFSKMFYLAVFFLVNIRSFDILSVDIFSRLSLGDEFFLRFRF